MESGKNPQGCGKGEEIGVEEWGGYNEQRRATGGTWEGAAGGGLRARGKKGSLGKQERKGQGEAGLGGG